MNSAKSIQFKFGIDHHMKIREVIADIIRGNYSSISSSNLARSANLPEGLYILLALISFFFHL